MYNRHLLNILNGNCQNGNMKALTGDFVSSITEASILICASQLTVYVRTKTKAVHLFNKHIFLSVLSVF